MDPCPAATDRARRHAEPRGRVLVEAARRVEARVVDRLGDRLRRAQLVRRAARPRLRRIGFRGHARDRLEDAMEMIGAQARARRKPGELRRLLGLIDLGARPPDRLELRIGRAGLVGTAALAGAEARLLGFSDGLEEGDILALGRARGAAWAAIDSGGADGEEEFPVEGRIAALDRLPALLVASRPRGLGLARFGHGHRHKQGSGVCLGPWLKPILARLNSGPCGAILKPAPQAACAWKARPNSRMVSAIAWTGAPGRPSAGTTTNSVSPSGGSPA